MGKQSTGGDYHKSTKKQNHTDNRPIIVKCIQSKHCIQSIPSKQRIHNVFVHAVEVLKNNKAGLLMYGHVPKKLQECQKLRKAMFHARFDEIGMLYSDIFGISFNKAVFELNIREELKIDE